MTDEANELLELIIAYAQAYCDWNGSEYSCAELYEEICKAVEELDKSGQNKMKKQDKIFRLLKWHGWERAETPEGVGYQRFRQVNRKKEMSMQAILNFRMEKATAENVERYWGRDRDF